MPQTLRQQLAQVADLAEKYNLDVIDVVRLYSSPVSVCVRSLDTVPADVPRTTTRLDDPAGKLVRVILDGIDFRCVVRS